MTRPTRDRPAVASALDVSDLNPADVRDLPPTVFGEALRRALREREAPPVAYAGHPRDGGGRDG